MGLPQYYPPVTEKAIATYDFEDIANGLGFVIFHPTLSEDSNFPHSLLASTALISASTTGLTESALVYEFRTSAFNLPKTAKGTAYLSGYANWTSGGGLIGVAKLSIESGTLSTDGEGSVSWTSSGEVSQNAGTEYVLKKTITIDGYVNKVTAEVKYIAPGTGSVKYEFIYEAGGTANVVVTSSSGTYATKTATNPNQDKRVFQIKVYLKRTSTGVVWEKTTQVYEENTSGLTVTDITSSVTTATMTADQGVLLELPLTETRIKRGENLLLRFAVTGGVGGFVVDPTSEVQTKESLKLNLPFRNDL